MLIHSNQNFSIEIKFIVRIKNQYSRHWQKPKDSFYYRKNTRSDTDYDEGYAKVIYYNEILTFINK